jgi:hypothetical protein
VAVSALPVRAPVTLPVKFPATVVVVNTPVDGLYVNPVSVLGDRLPVAAEANNGKLVALVELSAVRVTALAYVAVSALPVRSPVTLPVKFFTNGLVKLIVMLPDVVTGVLPIVMLASEVVNPTLVTVPAPAELTVALPDASNDKFLFALVAAEGMINVAVSVVGSATLNTLSVNMLSMS